MKLMVTICAMLALMAASAPTSAPKLAPHTYEVTAAFPHDRQPDGNSYVIEGPHGLTVIDTGRHATHRLEIVAVARELHKPVVAIVNTHWHLDHTSGNAGLRQAYPGLKVYASDAIDNALTGFMVDSAAMARKALADGKLPPTIQEDIQHDLATVEHGEQLKPDVVIDRTRMETFGGRKLELHLARNAATAGDVWVYDPATKIAFVGDLVTFPAPFLDTACSQGWTDALADVQRTDFKQAAPGHGPVLARAELESYHSAFDALIACSKSDAKAGACADGWTNSVSGIGKMSPEEKAHGREMAVYYVADVLRKNGGNSKYCAAAKP